MKIQVPVTKGQIVQIPIDAQGVDGEGIGKFEGFTVFVAGAIVGDFVRVQITKINHSYAFGRLEEIIEPSAFRVNPPCEIFEKCGGCNLMHVAYEQQLELKRQRVSDALLRIGGFEGITVSPTLGMKEPWRYRNKMQIPVGRDARGRLTAGFFEPRSHRIVPVKDCLVGGEPGVAACTAVLEYMEQCSIEPYDERTHSGVVRHIFVRHSEQTGQVMVVIIANALNLEHSEVLVSLLRRSVPGLASVIQNINMERTNLVLGRHNVTLWGSDQMEDVLGGLRFRISPASFYQVNSKQTERLYQTALDFAQLSGGETVFDLYCGIGTISLFMARHAEKVIGVEIVETAVEDARQNARENHLDNACFYAGAVEEVAPRLYEMGEHADVVMLDPPRKGADETTLRTVISMRPKRIVYVSCNPATLARDARLLADKGKYQIQCVQPVDMFAHTSHVETVMLMNREGSQEIKAR